MFKVHIKALFVLMNIFISFSLVYADNSQKMYCLSAGMGGTSVSNNRPELTLGLSANFASRKQLLGVRALLNQEFILFRTPLKTSEYAIYYGQHYNNKQSNAFLDFGGGISVVNYFTYGEIYVPPGNNLGTYHHLNSNYTMGIAVDVQTGFYLGKYFSLGAHGFADFNTKRTLAGALLSLRFGKIRFKKSE
ncbi:hypothetical protein BH09BAC5_BH09BAC5_14100 [soil metagenome]